MLLGRLLRSWSARPPHTEHAPSAEAPKREAEHLAGFNWLVRGRHGIFIASDNDIYVGRALIHYGEFSELEWALLARYCNPGDTVVEVGANIGSHTVSLSKAVGPEGRVIAIEPQPIIFQTLCGNLALNGLLNVETHLCGCAASAGSMSLPIADYESERNFAAISLEAHKDAPDLRTVAVKPLDELLADSSRVDFIKMDVEGMEADVLAGGRDVIDRFRPPMYIENDRVAKSKGLIEMLAGMGYRMWWHITPLYNPDNYYANPRNLYPTICSFNMLCLHATKSDAVAGGLEEITDSSARHPLARG